jgi:hypothetical protein
MQFFSLKTPWSGSQDAEMVYQQKKIVVCFFCPVCFVFGFLIERNSSDDRYTTRKRPFRIPWPNAAALRYTHPHYSGAFLLES